MGNETLQFMSFGVVLKFHGMASHIIATYDSRFWLTIKDSDHYSFSLLQAKFLSLNSSVFFGGGVVVEIFFI